jgi:hypothetical protein
VLVVYVSDQFFPVASTNTREELRAKRAGFTETTGIPVVDEERTLIC